MAIWFALPRPGSAPFRYLRIRASLNPTLRAKALTLPSPIRLCSLAANPSITLSPLTGMLATVSGVVRTIVRIRKGGIIALSARRDQDAGSIHSAFIYPSIYP
ncbi:hypothetical protein D3C76_1426890 [compost metagenome]